MTSYSNSQTICTPEQLASSVTSGVHCLTRKDGLGLVGVTVASFTSLVAICVIFALIARNIVRRSNAIRPLNVVRRLNDPKSKPLRLSLIKTSVDVYMLSLFTADLFQALGGSLEVKWINDGIVRPGSLCTAQGVMRNLGESGIALTTLIITVHTFASIWSKSVPMDTRNAIKTSYILVGVLWLYLILSIAISASIHRSAPFYVPTPVRPI